MQIYAWMVAIGLFGYLLYGSMGAHGTAKMPAELFINLHNSAADTEDGYGAAPPGIATIVRTPSKNLA